MRRIVGRGLGSVVSVAIAALACSAGEGETPSQLVLAFNTDMKLPEDIDRVALQVKVNGQVKHGQTYDVGPSGVRMPSTLTLVDDASQTAPVKIRLVALSKGVPMVLRDIVTTVPRNRIGMLRVPVQFLCYGAASVKDAQAQKEADPVVDLIASACNADADETCIAGGCTTAVIDSATLPDYVETEIFGGGTALGADGKCFDVSACFKGAGVVTPDASCSFALPAGVDAAAVNVGLRMAPGSPGVCDASGCVVALDAGGEGGFTVEGGRVKLPAAVCAKRADGLAVEVVASASCDAKTAAVPTCGPWSSVSSDNAVTPTRDGGLIGELPTDAGPDATVPFAGVKVLAPNQPGVGAVTITPEEARAYWSTQQANATTIMSYDFQKGSVGKLMDLPPGATVLELAASSSRVWFVASLSDGMYALYHCPVNGVCNLDRPLRSWMGDGVRPLLTLRGSGAHVVEPTGAGRKIVTVGDDGLFGPDLAQTTSEVWAMASSPAEIVWASSELSKLLRCNLQSCTGDGSPIQPSTLAQGSTPIESMALARGGVESAHAYWTDQTTRALWECPLSSCTGAVVVSDPVTAIAGALTYPGVVAAIQQGTKTSVRFVKPVGGPGAAVRELIDENFTGTVTRMAMGSRGVVYAACESALTCEVRYATIPPTASLPPTADGGVIPVLDGAIVP